MRDIKEVSWKMFGYCVVLGALTYFILSALANHYTKKAQQKCTQTIQSNG